MSFTMLRRRREIEKEERKSGRGLTIRKRGKQPHTIHNRLGSQAMSSRTSNYIMQLANNEHISC